VIENHAKFLTHIIADEEDLITRLI